MNITIAGTIVDQSWELIGVFEIKQYAINACVGANDFIAPIKLNAIAPRETTEFKTMEFPKVN